MYAHIYIYIYILYGGTSYQDPADQDPLSQNPENTALRN